MGVSSTHRDYDAFAPKWKRARDCVAGQDAIHKAGISYLPRLKDEGDPDYKARLKRSDFFNGTWRTIAGLGGMAFRKPPTIDVPSGIESYLEDINLAGLSMDALAMETLDEVLSVGRIGILVDHPAQPENVAPLTVEAAEQLGLRPTLQTYPAESIDNWEFGRVANKWVLTMVKLREEAVIGGDRFKKETETRWRVLDLDESGHYRQQLWRVNKDTGEDEQIGSDIYPQMNGKPLTYIPFALLGADGRGDQIDEPPLIDLIDANLALYGINADYRHGLHFTGLPTPVVSGYQPEKDGEKFYIGSTSAWVFPDPQAKATFLEFTGQGLSELREAIKEKKTEMALLGARMIADETKQAETLGATQIKRQGENSVLARIVQATSEALEWALGIFAEWAGHKGDVVYQINRDFLPAGMDAQQLQAYLAAVQAGEMSSESFFDLLQRSDVIDSEVTYDEERERIDSAGPPAPTMPRPKPDEGIAA